MQRASRRLPLDARASQSKQTAACRRPRCRLHSGGQLESLTMLKSRETRLHLNTMPGKANEPTRIMCRMTPAKRYGIVSFTPTLPSHRPTTDQQADTCTLVMTSRTPEHKAYTGHTQSRLTAKPHRYRPYDHAADASTPQCRRNTLTLTLIDVRPPKKVRYRSRSVVKPTHSDEYGTPSAKVHS